MAGVIRENKVCHGFFTMWTLPGVVDSSSGNSGWEAVVVGGEISWNVAKSLTVESERPWLADRCETEIEAFTGRRF